MRRTCRTGQTSFHGTHFFLSRCVHVRVHYRSSTPPLLISFVQESLVHVGLHGGRSAHVSLQTALRFIYRFNGQERTVVSTSVPANNRLTGNRQPDDRRNLYVLGLPFDLVQYVLSVIKWS